MARALVLLSPAARRGTDTKLRERLVSAIETALRARGLTAEFPAIGSVAEASTLLHGALTEGYEMAVIAGGDGTVRLAVNALAGTKLPLGIVPLGTGNLLAASLGIPRQPFAAAGRLSHASPTTIDSGLLEEDGLHERFAVAAGLGFDARVMAATGSAAKARFGVLAYFATVLRLLRSLPVSQTEIVVDGKTFELPTVAVLIANCGQIVPGLLGPRTALDPTDGLLDVIAIRGGASPSGIPIAARSALHSLLQADADAGGHSLRVRGERIVVRTNPPEPAEVDGDLLELGSGTFRATAQPMSLTVLV